MRARYVVLHFRAEIRRSSSARRDTSFFIRVPRYVVLHPRGEIRRSSSARRDTSFFIRAPRYVVLHPSAEIRSSSSQPSILSLNLVLSWYREPLANIHKYLSDYVQICEVYNFRPRFDLEFYDTPD